MGSTDHLQYFRYLFVFCAICVLNPYTLHHRVLAVNSNNSTNHDVGNTSKPQVEGLEVVPPLRTYTSYSLKHGKDSTEDVNLIRSTAANVCLLHLFEKYGNDEGKPSGDQLTLLLRNIIGPQVGLSTTDDMRPKAKMSSSEEGRNEEGRNDVEFHRGRSSILEFSDHSSLLSSPGKQKFLPCPDIRRLLRLHGFDERSEISTEDFVNFCPSIVCHLDCSNECFGHFSDVRHRKKTSEKHPRHVRDSLFQSNYTSCLRLGCGPPLFPTGSALTKSTNDTERTKKEWQAPQGLVWGYAIASCAIISAVGLLAVSIIPVMHKVIYNHMLQFLVALAIGSLTGDALLHLLPHALVPHRHEHDHDLEHSSDTGADVEERAVWLGLSSLGGIILFFIVERFVGLYSVWRRMQRAAAIVNARKAPSKPVVQFNKNAHLDAPLSAPCLTNSQSGETSKTIGSKLSHHLGATSCEEALMMVHSSKEVKKLAVDAHDELHKNCDLESNVAQSSWDFGRNTKGHQHGHDVPGSVASVAWMVVIGDGFHNFADGIAIGSSFAIGFSDGLSTSIAVFCHELPHELGDFAMLLNAGMTAKMSLVYNCVSSILCFLGMTVGLLIGNFESASSWIFAVIAGMFLYIALVDMLPEMKSVNPKQGEHPLIHLGLQLAGISLGAGIMLVIALFEDRIRFN